MYVCIRSYFPPEPSPQIHPPLPLSTTTMLPPFPSCARESSSNSSFSSTITFLPVGFYRLSLSLSSSLSFFPPQPLSCSPCLCFMPPFSRYIPLLCPRASSTTPLLNPIPPQASFRRPHLFARCVSPPTCVSRLFPSRLPNRR